MKNKILLLVLFTLPLFIKAQVKSWDNPKPQTVIQTEQWEVNDLIFHTKGEIDKPFEAYVYALIKDEEGVQKVPLFYNGSDEWVFRYSSHLIGSKTYELHGDIKELTKKTGKINVAENTKKDRHGAVGLKKEDPQHFYYQDGTHYFNLAFECDWLFALDYGKDELAKTNQLLSTIAENGFNQVVMNVYASDVLWPKDENLSNHPEYEYGGREDIFPFLGSNSKPDYSSLNVDFFKHFDKVISSMHDKEIVSHLMIYVWNKMVAWPEFDSEADDMYYDYVIKRYQAFPNIIWDVSKEALLYGNVNKNYISDRISRTRELDNYKRLVSVHDYGYCRNNPDEVDFISSQNWQHTLYQNMITAKEEFPDKPIFNIEHGGYEESEYKVFPGVYTNAESCLRRNYMCLFAGSYTTYYWQGTSWNVVIHDPFEQEDNVYKPHFEYFKHMRNLFEKFPFEKFRPNPKANLNGYNLTNDEDGIVMLFVPKENFTIMYEGYMHKNYDTSETTLQWFNTLTGEFSEVQKINNTKKHNFWPWQPWRGEADTILILQNLKPKN